MALGLTNGARSHFDASLLRFSRRVNCGGSIHTGRRTRCTARRKQMGPIDVNGGIHTALKQHQRKNIPICARVASRVLCGWGRTSPQLDWYPSKKRLLRFARQCNVIFHYLLRSYPCMLLDRFDHIFEGDL